MRVALWGIGLLILAGCASGERTTSAEERIEQTQQAMRETEDVLSTARNQLQEFSGELTELRKEAATKEDLRAKERIQGTLDQLQVAVERSELELREIQMANASATRDLERNLRRAARRATPEFEEPEESGAEEERAAE